MYLTLEQVKQHLIIDNYFSADDSYIECLINVAEDSISKHLNTPLASIVDGETLPPSIVHAMLLMIGNLYANREPVVYGNVSKLPLAYEYLINLYRNYEHIL